MLIRHVLGRVDPSVVPMRPFRRRGRRVGVWRVPRGHRVANAHSAERRAEAAIAHRRLLLWRIALGGRRGDGGERRKRSSHSLRVVHVNAGERFECKSVLLPNQSVLALLRKRGDVVVDPGAIIDSSPVQSACPFRFGC